MVEPSQLLIGGGYISLAIGRSRNEKFLVRALPNFVRQNKIIKLWKNFSEGKHRLNTAIFKTTQPFVTFGK
jgi:hypothetical protein